MSINFTCPSCQTRYTVHDRDAGKKSDCKKCGQRIIAPFPPRAKTVLGEIVEPPVPQRSKTILGEVAAGPDPREVVRSKTILGELPPIEVQQPTGLPTKPVPIMPIATRLGEFYPLAKSPLPPPRSFPSTGPSNKNKQIAIILFGSVALILVGILVIILVASGKKSDTPAAKKDGAEQAAQSINPEIEGEKWSIEAMGKHLKSKGMDSLTLNYVRSDDRSKTLSFFRFAPSASREHLIESKPHELRHAVEVITTPDPWPKPADLKDAASRMNVEHQGTAFAWGRFLFRGDAAYILKIRSILK